MAIEDFFPFVDGQRITAEQWNELFTAIRNGSFFLDTTPISEQIVSLSDRVTALELRVGELEQIQKWRMMREQFVLTDHQSYIQLSHTPLLDSEDPILNGMSLAKNGIPVGFLGDYYMDGSRVQFTDERKAEIFAGDQVVVLYQYEV